MFGHNKYNRNLHILKANQLTREDSIRQIEQKLRRIQNASKWLKGRFSESTIADKRFEDFDIISHALHQYLENGEPITPARLDEYNNSLTGTYEYFHGSDLKKHSTMLAIKKRLEFYGVDPDIKVSARGNPQTGETISKADLEQLSQKSLLIYLHGTDHASRSWYHIGGLFRTAYKAGLIEASKKSPASVRIVILRLLGAYIGSDVHIGGNVQLDYFFPELIRIEDNVSIGDHSKLWTHDFSIKKFAFAPLVIQEGAVIEDNCIIGPVEIGKSVRVKSHSVVLRHLPERIKVYDNADPQYYAFLEHAMSGVAYEKLVHRLVGILTRFIRILPYDPLPRDVPLIGKLALIDRLPAIHLKNRLYRKLGMKIHKNVTIGPRVFVDAIHPELIELEEGVLVGDGAMFRPYDMDGKPKKIHIGKNSKIGSQSIIFGCTIGNNTLIGIKSVVVGDIPSNVTARGAPARVR